jgi:hypothetical protein
MDDKICIFLSVLQRNRSRSTQSYVKKQFARTNHRRWLTILQVLQGIFLNIYSTLRFDMAMLTWVQCVEFEILTAVAVQSIISWDVTQHSPVESYLHFRGTYYLHLQGHQLTACSASSLIWKVEAKCSSEMSVNFYQTTWCHIQKISTLEIQFGPGHKMKIW